MRMGGDIPKQFIPLKGKPVLMRTLEAFYAYDPQMELILVLPVDQQAYWKSLCEKYAFTLPHRIADGGETRFHSVRNGLALVGEDGLVGVHDGVRPFVSPEVIGHCYDQAVSAQAVVPVIDVVETVRRIEENGSTTTVPRDRYKLVQTPQVFTVSLLKHAYHQEYKPAFTDDASVVEALGIQVALVKGNRENIKLTTPEDMLLARQVILRREGQKEEKPMVRIGHGYDVHRLTEERKLILCGVEIPYTLGLLGHSDADVALHALMDALLGAAALGDIGRHFPDTDPAYKGADSGRLLDHVVALLEEKGYAIGNVDVTIICQRPKLKDYIEQMRQNVARHLKVDADCVNIKATTTEKLGFEGEGLGISSHAVACIESA